jgi:hypothetical protein
MLLLEVRRLRKAMLVINLWMKRWRKKCIRGAAVRLVGLRLVSMNYVQDLLGVDLAGSGIVGNAEEIVEEVICVEGEEEVESLVEEETVVVEVAEEALGVDLVAGEVHVGGENEQEVDVGELGEGAREEGVLG